MYEKTYSKINNRNPIYNSRQHLYSDNVQSRNISSSAHMQLEMWANAQRDGRHAKLRWRPLFNAAKFG